MNEIPASRECETTQLELSAFVDGELSSAEQTTIEHHLESCAACRAAVGLLRLVTQSLGLVARPEPSEAMRQRLLVQVTAELPARRMEIVSNEQRGTELIRRREVRLSHEPAPSPRLIPAAAPIGVFVQRIHRQGGYRSHCYQLAERIQEGSR